MDTQHHKSTTISAGHEGHEGHEGYEGHGVHLCHRCGWPFPNPHPSAKHRRAHKRVCGKIEGYKVEHDHHLPVSDDDKTSDEEEHTPNSMPVKKHVADIDSSGAVGEMSNRSEDDVFADAVTEFSESGLSPQSSGRFESVTGLINGEGKKGSGSDILGTESLNINSASGKTEPYNDSVDSKETSNPGALVHPNVQSGTVLLVSDSSAEADSGGLGNNLPDDVIKSEIMRDVVEDDGKKCVNRETLSDQRKAGQDSDIPAGGNNLTFINVDSEGVISDCAITMEKKEEELHDKLVPENTNASAGIEKVCAATEEVKASGVAGDILHEEAPMSRAPDKDAESTLSLDANKPDDAALSIEEIKQRPNFTEVETTGNSGVTEVGSARITTLSEVETSGNDTSNGAKCDEAGNENDSWKSEHKHSVGTVSAPGFVESGFVAEAVQTTEVLKGDVNHCEEKSDRKNLDAVTEMGGGDLEEVKVIHARNMEELSKSGSSTVESYVENSFPGQSSDKRNEELHFVGTDVGGLNHNVDVTATSEHQVSQGISELPSNIPVPSDEPVPKDSAFTELGLLNENSDKKSRCIREGVGELDDSKASAEPNHDDSVAVFTEKSDGLDRTQHENLPKECSKEIIPDEEKLIGVADISPDTSQAKPISIVLNADQTSGSSKVAASERCSDTPSSKEAAPSLLHSQELRETSTPYETENVINAEPVTAANSNPLLDKHEEKLSISRDVVSAKDLSSNSSVKSESLDGNCGTVSEISFESNMAVANSPSSESLITSLQQHEAATEGSHRHKSDDFDPPSFMTLVQTDGKESEVSTASEIEMVQSNQQPKSEAVQPGWFPSLTNMVNESDGRKKNEEIIAKVTHSSPVKNHGPLKNLLNEAKQVPAANPKDETEPIVNNGAGATKSASAQNYHDTHKEDINEWNSPARYPIETKKDKKKGKSIWVPFLCCSSVH